MTFDSTDHAFCLDTSVRINPQNQTFSDVIGLYDSNHLPLYKLYGSSLPGNPLPDNLDDQIDIQFFQTPDYPEKTALISPVDSIEFFATPDSQSSNGTSTDGFGVPYNKTSGNLTPLSSPSQSSNSPSAGQNSSPSQSSNAAINDWVNTHLLDPQLITITQNLAADGQLSRNDMIAIFRDAEDNSVIDANEYRDLQTIVNNASYFHMEDYVRVLSSKVVFGTSANANYQGQALGNLYAGSSSTQMEKLIGKWFLGNDRPSTSYTYVQAAGSLFQNGVSYQDISQGLVGDCYFLAGLAETAIHSPSTIQSMFIDNGDQTYTVRFYNNGIADYVTVDKYLPVDSSNEFVYANQPGANWGKYYDPSNELWVALAEKAYAQINEAGWIGQDGTNSYAGINGGWDTDAYRQITGTNARSSTNFDLNSLVNAYNAGTLLGVSSKTSGILDTIVPNHVYVVVGYDSSTQQFTLFNPWGVDGGLSNGITLPGYIRASINVLQANFYQWSYTA